MQDLRGVVRAPGVGQRDRQAGHQGAGVLVAAAGAGVRAAGGQGTLRGRTAALRDRVMGRRTRRAGLRPDPAEGDPALLHQGRPPAVGPPDERLVRRVGRNAFPGHQNAFGPLQHARDGGKALQVRHLGPEPGHHLGQGQYVGRRTVARGRRIHLHPSSMARSPTPVRIRDRPASPQPSLRSSSSARRAAFSAVHPAWACACSACRYSRRASRTARPAASMRCRTAESSSRRSAASPSARSRAAAVRDRAAGERAGWRRERRPVRDGKRE